MAKKQILTYPYGTKYQTSNWGDQVKNGHGGSIPCNNEVHVGNYIQNTGGTNWWGESGFGSDNGAHVAGTNDHWDQLWQGTSQKGLCHWMQTKENGKTTARWFDIGSEGGKTDGTYCDKNARSSWLSEVTGLYFLFNSHDTTETRDCYSQVEHAAIRYRDPRGYIRIKRLTHQLGDLSYGVWKRGSKKYMFGYRLSNSECDTICKEDYHFLGIRLQLKLKRGASGTHTDYIQAGVTGLRLYLGKYDNNWNTTNKRALVLRGNTTWNDFSNPDKQKDMLETR